MVLVIVATLASPVAGQTDLEALYSLTLDVTNKDPTWSLTTPPCQWKGVSCNATGNVTQISWGFMRLSGVQQSVHFGGKSHDVLDDIFSTPTVVTQQSPPTFQAQGASGGKSHDVLDDIFGLPPTVAVLCVVQQ